MKHYSILIIFLALAAIATAQTDNVSRWNYTARIGLNIGAASPTSIPQEIREIKGFNPHLNLTAEASVGYRFSQRWTLTTGLKFEQMGMSTYARVKNYSTEITSEGSKVAGVWTGEVETDFSANALTLPLTVGYDLSRTLTLRVGFYGSYLMQHTFGGEVHDGYLRQGNPTGEKVVFDSDSHATYNFDNELRDWHCGTTVALDIYPLRHLVVTAQISYGFLNIFNNDFQTISFSMHPIFGNIAIGYRL